MAETNIRIVIGAFEDFAEKIIKDITLEATANLIEDTPVDTGWARANWIPSITTPVEENLTGVDPEPGQVAGAKGKQSNGIAQVATRYRIKSGAVFITNNVPYVPRLNDGSSVQAPSGFVQAAIRKAIAIASRIRSP